MDELQSLHNQLVTPDGHCALMRIWPTLMPIWPTLMRIWPTLMRIWAEDNVLHRGIQVYKQLHYGVGSMAGTMGTVGTMGTMWVDTNGHYGRHFGHCSSCTMVHSL